MEWYRSSVRDGQCSDGEAGAPVWTMDVGLGCGLFRFRGWRWALVTVLFTDLSQSNINDFLLPPRNVALVLMPIQLRRSKESCIICR